MVIWVTGNTKSGKTTWAKNYLNRCKNENTVHLDGDDLRLVWRDLGLSKEDRIEQNLRTARLANLFSKQGFDVIVSTICPYRDLRDRVKAMTKCTFVYLEGGKSGEDYPYDRP